MLMYSRHQALALKICVIDIRIAKISFCWYVGVILTLGNVKNM